MEILKRLVLAVVFLAVTGIFCCAAAIIYQTTNPTAALRNLLVGKNGKIKTAFFSPQDQIKNILINLIDHEQERISAAAYTITDKDIAEAFIRAFKRGIYIELVVDRCYGADKYSKVPLLANSRLFIMTYAAAQKENNSYQGLMHNKFLIFKKNFDNHSIIFTGSFNLTKAANFYNQENVVILNSPRIIARYENAFQNLKNNSIIISGSRKNYTIKTEDKADSWYEKALRILGIA